jgi:mono/diheme cytochrome c family protein
MSNEEVKKADYWASLEDEEVDEESKADLQLVAAESEPDQAQADPNPAPLPNVEAATLSAVEPIWQRVSLHSCANCHGCTY